MSMIQQWREASISLSSALKAYLDACMPLKATIQHLAVNTEAKDFIHLIDEALGPGGFHATLAQQLTQSRSILAQARNGIAASPIYHLPEEILVKIFTNVIYDHRRNTAMYMGSKLKSIYKRLHTLLGVCSAWRKIGVNHSTFWYLVPLVHGDPGFPIRWATGLSLQRACGRNLHLAAIISQNTKPSALNIGDMGVHISRFRSINILAESTSGFCKVLDRLFNLGSPISPTDLSLCLDYEVEQGINVGTHLEKRFLFEKSYTYLAQFTKMLESVSRIRLSGAGTYWNRVTFSDRLVELRLEGFVLGYKSDLDALLVTLSAASELQFLSLISIITFIEQTPGAHEESAAKFEIFLPKLKSLHIEDLYFNTLQIVIEAIVQGSHHLTLFLTPKCLQVAAPIEAEFENRRFEAVCDVVSRARVGTLMLCADHSRGWLNERDFEMILRSSPSLVTLKLERWKLQAPLCRALTRPHNSNHIFPRIKSLHLTCVTVYGQQEFKDMISSHSDSLEHMVLGVAFYSKSVKPCFLFRDLKQWLIAHVPYFQLTPGDYTPPEFESRVWQLW